MRRPHQNVATVLVDPRALRDLELELMALDLWVWPVATAGISADGPRLAFQIRRRLVQAKRGRVGPSPRSGRRSGSRSATAGTPATSRSPGPRTPPCGTRSRPTPTHTRYRLGLGGIPKLAVHRETDLA